MKRLSLIIGLFLIFLFLLPLSLVRAEGRGVGLSPLTFEMTVNPGDTEINQLKVYNPNEESQIGIKMEVEDFTVIGEIGHVKIEPAETETYSIARWVTIDSEEFILGPGEQKFIEFTIDIPDDAEPGGHYGSILAKTTSVVGGEFAGAAVAGRVGALVLLSVSGEVRESLSVESFSVPNYSEYGPINFELRFKNTGTVHLKPRGHLTITNWLGTKVADLEVPQNNVLPGSIRKIDIPWSEKWLWAGKYTATLSANYGVSNSAIEPVVISFWAFPWKVGVVVLLVIFFFVLTRKRWAAAFRILLKGDR